MRTLPPSTTGQPTACASMPSSSANAPVPGAPSGRIEWAPNPASSARPWSVLNGERAPSSAKARASRSGPSPGDGPEERAAAPAPRARSRRCPRRAAQRGGGRRARRRPAPLRSARPSLRRRQLGRRRADGRRRFRSLQREPGKRLLREEGRGREQRVNGRADVVRKAGKRQLLGAAAAARRVRPPRRRARQVQHAQA